MLLANLKATDFKDLNVVLIKESNASQDLIILLITVFHENMDLLNMAHIRQLKLSHRLDMIVVLSIVVRQLSVLCHKIKAFELIDREEHTGDFIVTR